MGFILDALSGFGKSLLGGIGENIGNRAAEAAGDKVFGVPSHLTGAQLGEAQRQYMDAAFPGTNPWERLGQSSALTPVQVAKENRRTQNQLVRQTTGAQKSVARINQETQLKVADKNNEASLIGAFSQYGPDGLKALQGMRSGAPVSDYHTQVTQNTAKLFKEMTLLDAQAKETLERATHQHYAGLTAKEESQRQRSQNAFRETLTRLDVAKGIKDQLGWIGKIFPWALTAVFNAKNSEDLHRKVNRIVDTYSAKAHDGATSIGSAIKENLGEFFK